MRRTKIVCTMGPNTDKKTVMKALVKNGMDVARFNFSHGDHEEHKNRMNLLKNVREELDKPVAILLDTKGPEIRTGLLEGGKKVMLQSGGTFTLYMDERTGNEEGCSITYPGLVKEVKKLPDSYVDKFDELVKSIELIKSIDEAEDQIASSTVNELKDISAQLTTIKADLAKKEGEYEEVVKTLKKEQSTKLFANVGLVLGFQKSAPVYGANANVGIRLGKSMTLSVGAQYMFGSFSNMVFDNNIDRLAFTGSIGWEW